MIGSPGINIKLIQYVDLEIALIQQHWRVDHWVAQQPPSAWQPVTLRDGTKGALQVEMLHHRVWLWNGEEAQARPWHLIVRREVETPTEIKYSLSWTLALTPHSRVLQ